MPPAPYCFAIEKSALAANDQRIIRRQFRDVEYRLHEIFEMIGLLKNRRTLAWPDVPVF